MYYCCRKCLEKPILLSHNGKRKCRTDHFTHTSWQARDALEFTEERNAQQRQQEREKEERRAAARLKHTEMRAGASPKRAAAPDPLEDRTHNAPLLHHLSPAPAVSEGSVKPQGAQSENSNHAGGQGPEKGQRHLDGKGDSRGERAEGVAGEEHEGGEATRAKRTGDDGEHESNDVAFVLRKLYTGGGLDAQQQSWKCMPTNLFNTLTLQLGTLSKVGFPSKIPNCGLGSLLFCACSPLASVLKPNRRLGCVQEFSKAHP